MPEISLVEAHRRGDLFRRAWLMRDQSGVTLDALLRGSYHSVSWKITPRAYVRRSAEDSPADVDPVVPALAFDGRCLFGKIKTSP